MRVKANKWLSMSPIQRLKTLQLVSRFQKLELIFLAHGIDPAELKATRKMLERLVVA